MSPMDEQDPISVRFEENRPRLRAVAYRMLGSLSEADDAVQEAWLRLNRTDPATVDNLNGWLTTVVSRVCLDVLRARKSRREEPIDAQVANRRVVHGDGADPEGEVVLADAVGVALLVVLEALSPAERLAFVLHDLFAMPFAEIGAIVGRSPAAAKQLASRARRRVRGSAGAVDAGRTRQREVVEAFLRAVRAGDIEGLLAVLDPDAVIHIDAAARTDGVVRVDVAPADVGKPREVKGAINWVHQMVALSRGMRSTQVALIDGTVGVVFAPRGTLLRALLFSFADAHVTRIEAIGDPVRLRALDIRAL